MPTAPHPSAADSTRDRLIQAAGEVFAELGFRAATIRDISARAGANIAAVNYHFGDKQALYAQALRYAHACAVEKYPPDLGLPPSAPPARRLEAFVRSFLLRLLDPGRPAWHAKLMTRELAEPTAALDVLVHEQIKPHFLGLGRIVRELVGEGVPDAVVRTAGSSIVGQCLFYHFGAPVSARLFPERPHTAADVDALTAHIVTFSLGGLKAVARETLQAPRADRARPDARRKRRG